MLRRAWHALDLRPRWIGRDVVGADAIRANILVDQLELGPAGVVLALAGVVRGTEAELALNTDLALAGCALAARSGARRVLVASSGAVYGPGVGQALTETCALAPANAYGRAKVRMEQAVLDWAASPGRPAVTLLRIGNIAGLDALLGGNPPDALVTLDPVPGRPGGPVRSYIGVRALAEVLAALCGKAGAGKALPDVLNIAADPAVTMGALLEADGRRWTYGAENPAVIPSVVLDTGRLKQLLPEQNLSADPARMVREWHSLAGGRE